VAVCGGAAVGSGFAGRRDRAVGVASVANAVGTRRIALSAGSGDYTGPRVALGGARIGPRLRTPCLGAARIVFAGLIVDDSFMIAGWSGGANIMSAARAGMSGDQTCWSSASRLRSNAGAGLGAQQNCLVGATVGLGGGRIGSSGVLLECSFDVRGVGGVCARLTRVHAVLTRVRARFMTTSTRYIRRMTVPDCGVNGLHRRPRTWLRWVWGLV
jgi:hypothetical protein